MDLQVPVYPFSRLLAPPRTAVLGDASGWSGLGVGEA